MLPEHSPFTRAVTDAQAVGAVTPEQAMSPGDYLVSLHPVRTFIDEAALGIGWSNKKRIKQSLLVHFHNEARR